MCWKLQPTTLTRYSKVKMHPLFNTEIVFRDAFKGEALNIK